MSSQSYGLQPLVKTEWDHRFVSNEAYRAWVLAQLQTHPIQEGEPLVHYVSRRISSGVDLMPQSQALQHASPASMMQQAVPSPSLAPQQLHSVSLDPVITNGNGHTSMPDTSNGPIRPSSAQIEGTNNPLYTNATLMVRPAGQQSRKSPSPMPSPSTPVDSPATPNLPPASSSANAPSASASKEAWQEALPQFRTYLDGAINKLPVRSVRKLGDLLSPFIASESLSVPPEGRTELLEQLLSKGTKDYFQALAQTSQVRDVLESWCAEAISAGRKDSSNKALLGTLSPCLRILKSMPYTLDYVKESKVSLPKLLGSVGKRDTYPVACRDIANELVQDWRGLLHTRETAQQAKQDAAKRKIDPPADDDNRKRRKVTPPSASASASTAEEKPKPGPSKATEPKPTLTSLLSKGGNSGGALKSLSIGKGGGSGAGASGQGSSTSSSRSGGFASVFASLTSGSKDNAAAKASSAPSPASGGIVASEAEPGASKGLLKKKSTPSTPYQKKKHVTWKRDEDLVAVKVIEKAIYEMDYDHAGQLDLQTMEHNEGMLMRRDEELKPWSEPPPVANVPTEEMYPPPEPLFQFGEPAAVTQEASDNNAMPVDEEPEFESLESPFEPENESSAGPAASEPLMMVHSSNMMDDPDFSYALNQTHPPAIAAPSPQITELLARLNGTAAASMSAPAHAPPSDAPAPLPPQTDSFRSFAPEAAPPVFRGAQNQAYNDFGRGAPPNAGRKQHGPGSSFKTVPCKFFANGTGFCKQGDQCSFRH